MLAWGLAEARAAVPASAPSRDGVRACAHRRWRALALPRTRADGAGGWDRRGRGRICQPAPRSSQAPHRRRNVTFPSPAKAATGCDPRIWTPHTGSRKTPVSTQTIAIVTAGGDPTIKKDLANYDSEFGLPGCPGETPCPTVLDGQGKRHLPPVEGDAPLETSLDVEVAHAVCPGCDLLLIEASSASLAAFEEATDTAARLGADEISISWGEAEPAQVVKGGAAFDHPGVVITAAAGDTGYLNWASPEAERGRPEYPASSPDVIAVGGTDLELGPTGEWQGEQVWDQLEPDDEAGGSGCSTLFDAPSWQLELADWERGRLWRDACHGRRGGDRRPQPWSGRLRRHEGHRRPQARVAAPRGDQRRCAADRSGLRARRGGSWRGLPGADPLSERGAWIRDCCTTSRPGRMAPVRSSSDAAAAPRNRARTALRGRSASPVPATTGPPAWGACRGSGCWSRASGSGPCRPRRPGAATPSPWKRRRSHGTAGNGHLGHPRRLHGGRGGGHAARGRSLHAGGRAARIPGSAAELRRRAHAPTGRLLLRRARPTPSKGDPPISRRPPQARGCRWRFVSTDSVGVRDSGRGGGAAVRGSLHDRRRAGRRRRIRTRAGRRRSPTPWPPPRRPGADRGVASQLVAHRWVARSRAKCSRCVKP